MLVSEVYGEAMKVDKRIALAIGAVLIVGSGVALAVSRPYQPKSAVKTEAVEQATPAVTTPTTETSATPEPVKTTSNQTADETDPTPAPITVVSKKATWTEGTGDSVVFFWTCETTWSDGTVTKRSLGSNLEPDNTTHQPRGTMVCPKN